MIISNLKSTLSAYQIRHQLESIRQHTLSWFDPLFPDSFCCQPHPDFSPIGWHLGHIGHTESYWILEQLEGKVPRFSHYQQLFSATYLPKRARCQLPSFAAILAYLQTIRSAVFEYLEKAPLEAQIPLWQWLLQHEAQHAETIAIVLALQLHNPQLRLHSALRARLTPPQCPPKYPRKSPSQQGHPLGLQPTDPTAMVYIPAGRLLCGGEGDAALDNEQPRHWRWLDAFWIDPHPVTQGEYAEFIQSGGYEQPQYWSEAGWLWVQTARDRRDVTNLMPKSIPHSRYWQPGSTIDTILCGINAYEAEAYAQFRGKRLPTEFEWEKATQYLPAQSMLGLVWQWTSSSFVGYQSFQAYPYPGYSQVYFDGHHRVLKGGSWLTSPYCLRPSFRNWYAPEVREVFAGIRCVSDRSL